MIDMLKYENPLWNSGHTIVAGIDEVGRGSLAGPLVTAAVVWNKDFISNSTDPELSQINDSKKVTEKNRIRLSEFILANAEQYHIVEISNDEIDESGVGEANKKALNLAASGIKNLDYLLIDHFKLGEFKQISITKGDSLSLSIAAASIIAKVYRDMLMKQKYHDMYPAYGFNSNVGYGTKAHMQAIRSNGYSAIHRRSFKIVL